jgi:uncharacterized oxidoreductase
LKKTNIKVFDLVAPGAKTPLNDKFGGDVDSRMMMEPDKLVKVAIHGLTKNKFEILPGIAGIMKFLSRIAPGVLFNQFSKIAEKSLAQAA